LSKALGNIKADIAAINDLATATLDYAILERADMSNRNVPSVAFRPRPSFLYVRVLDG
jgi:hypothetical protein